MKKIIRIALFSMLAVYLTSLWNFGFTYPHDPVSFIKTGLVIGLIFYLILPVAKIILIPLNIVTLGFASILFYFGLLHVLNITGVITVKPWDFYGLAYFIINIPKFHVSYPVNVFLSALSISTIINLEESLI